MKKFEPVYNFYQLTPAIFLLEIDGNNDLAHTFLRAQEFYESGNDNFREKNFSLEDYKKWYCSQSATGEFSYGEDWRGFNIPSQVIDRCYEMNSERTKEDLFFLSICEKAKKIALESHYDNYYILGVRKGDIKTLNHEIAHGLFSTNIEYKEMMTEAVKRVEIKTIQPLFDSLKEMGYGENVFIDEAQAYLSTGLKDAQKSKALNKLTPLFKKNFQKFMSGWVLPTPLERNIIES